MNEQQDISINLIELLKLLWRKVIYIVGATLLGLVFGLAYANTMLTPEYTASGTFVINRAINIAMVNAASEVAKSTKVLELAVISLEDDGITAVEGNDINVSLLKAGLSISSKADVPSITVAFKSKSSEYNDEVVNAVISATVVYGNENYSVFTANLIEGELATSSIYTGSSKTIFYAVGVLLGGMMGVGAVLVYSFLGGKVMLMSHYSQYGIPYHLMKFNAKNDIEEDMMSKVLRLQSKVEANYPEKKVSVIGFMSPQENKYLDQLIVSYARNYSENGFKTLVIDLDFINPSLSEILDVGESNDTIVDMLERDNEPHIHEVKKNLAFVEGGKSLFSSRIIKNIKFVELINSYKSSYDFVLIKETPNELDDSYLVLNEYVDSLLVSVVLEKTKKNCLDQLIDESVKKHSGKLYLNFIEKS